MGRQVHRVDGVVAGKTTLLDNKGSVYDLVAMFISLIGGDKDFANKICILFNEYLDKGYTYQDIKTEIFKCFYDKRHVFRWNIFNNPKQGDRVKINYVKSNTRYYHNQLKLVNAFPIIEKDINSGTITSRVSPYYLEPIASYTIQDFTRYFYSIMPVDTSAHAPSYMAGLFKHYIEKFGIDKVLFMTDIYAEECKSDQKIFSTKYWNEYSSPADARINEIKGTFAEGKNYYTLKQRNLFDV